MTDGQWAPVKLKQKAIAPAAAPDVNWHTSQWIKPKHHPNYSSSGKGEEEGTNCTNSVLLKVVVVVVVVIIVWVRVRKRLSSGALVSGALCVPVHWLHCDDPIQTTTSAAAAVLLWLGGRWPLCENAANGNCGGGGGGGHWSDAEHIDRHKNRTELKLAEVEHSTFCCSSSSRRIKCTFIADHVVLVVITFLLSSNLWPRKQCKASVQASELVSHSLGQSVGFDWNRGVKVRGESVCVWVCI